METHLLKPDSCAVQCNDMSSCRVGQCAGVWPSQTFVSGWTLKWWLCYKSWWLVITTELSICGLSTDHGDTVLLIDTVELGLIEFTCFCMHSW